MLNGLMVVVAGLALFVVGTLFGMEYQRLYLLEATYDQYNHIRIYEDGSYEGQLMDGSNVKGCIEGAICDE